MTKTRILDNFFSTNLYNETPDEYVERVQYFVQKILGDIKPVVCKDCIIYANCSTWCDMFRKSYNKEERRRLAYREEEYFYDKGR